MSGSRIDLSLFCIRARSFIAQGRIEDALGLYGDVLQVDPINAMAYADRGTAYAMLKKFELALSDLNKAFSLGYQDSSAYSTTATILFELKDFQKSLEYFSRAIELDSGYPLAYYNRSNVFYEIGNYNAAISDLEKCLEFNSGEDFKKLINNRLSYIKEKRLSK